MCKPKTFTFELTEADGTVKTYVGVPEKTKELFLKSFEENDRVVTPEARILLRVNCAYVMVDGEKRDR